MDFKNVFVTKIFITSLFYIITYSSSPLSFTVHLHPTHCQPALRIQPSVNYYLICDDPVNFQYPVSWAERQSRLVELKDALLPLGSTPTDLHFQIYSLPLVSMVLNLLFGILQMPLQVSRNQDWDSSTSSLP